MESPQKKPAVFKDSLASLSTGAGALNLDT